MARKHAQVVTSIWMDDDFAALGGMEQRMYLFLLSQPDLSLAGVLVTRPKAWARRCGDLTVDACEAHLEALERHRLIVWDRDTDELWLRSFQKHNVALSPKTLIGSSRAFQAVQSPVLRRCVAASVHPVVRDGFVSGLDEFGFDRVKELVGSAGEWIGPSWPDLGVDAPSDTPSHAPSDTPCEGASPLIPDTGYLTPDTGVTTSPEPSSASLELVPTPSAPASPERQTYPDDFERFWSQYPRKTGKGAAAKAFRKATKGSPHRALAITSAAREHTAAWRNWPESDRQFIPHPATWLNECRYDDPPPEARRPSGPVTKADRNQQAIAESVARMTGGGAS